MWFGKWFTIFTFEFILPNVLAHFNLKENVSFHMRDDFFKHPRKVLLDLGFWGHTSESIGHQMHVAYKDFRSYCSHHRIECSQPAFTKGQVALLESKCFVYSCSACLN